MSKKILKNGIAVLISTSMLLSPMITFAAEENIDQNYEKAIIDAMTADIDEIKPLVNINPDNPDTFWDEDKCHVLMASFHRWPDSYPEHTVINTLWGDSWLVSAQEFLNWYAKNSEGVNDWTLRYNQLIGMPSDSKNNTISLLWVKPSSLIRPAYVRDINLPMTNEFTVEPDAEYMKWFNEYSCSSYQTGGYPWTRLGYTYDWADNGTSYGLSEFVLEKGSDVVVEKTMSLDEYIKWIQQ